MTLHAIGDSHADYCFAGIPGLRVHWLGPRTMHRVGRDGTDLLDLGRLGLVAGDTAILSFGEIDVRTHLGRISRERRIDLRDLIDGTVCRYLATACANRALRPGVRIVVSSVIPPSDRVTRQDETLPFYGTLQERVLITCGVNAALARFCGFLGFPLIDVYTPFAGRDGALPLASRADLLHLHRRFVGITAKNLRALLGSLGR